MAITFDKLERALQLAASGMLPGKIFAELEISPQTFSAYRLANPDYAKRFNDARLVGAEYIAESTIKTAKTKPPAVAREINSATWMYLRKLFPQQYGDQVEVKVSTAPSLAGVIAEGIARSATQMLPSSRSDGGTIELERLPASDALDTASVPTFAPPEDDEEQIP